MGEKRKSQQETKKRKHYGQYTIESDRAHRRQKLWYVVDRDGNRYHVATGRHNARRRAQALAAALDAADVYMTDGIEAIMPPDEVDGEDWSGSRFGNNHENDWANWSLDNSVVPVKLMKDGNYSVSGWLHGVYDIDPKWIAQYLDVSEQSVRQYLSDLRSGRRS